MDLSQWSEHLFSIAAPALAGTPLDPAAESEACEDDARAFVASFVDEAGHRRAVDVPLLTHLLGIAPDPSVARAAGSERSPDLAIWWALHSGSAFGGAVEAGPGPILGDAEFARGAIETTTETELAALHGLWHHVAAGSAGDGGAIRDRCFEAARWHVDTLQPDNGTNHPWAIHVFLRLATMDDAYAGGASLHAEALLHNAIVRTGRPDRFSACVLLDAARELACP